MCDTGRAARTFTRRRSVESDCGASKAAAQPEKRSRRGPLRIPQTRGQTRQAAGVSRHALADLPNERKVSAEDGSAARLEKQIHDLLFADVVTAH